MPKRLAAILLVACSATTLAAQSPVQPVAESGVERPRPAGVTRRPDAHAFAPLAERGGRVEAVAMFPGTGPSLAHHLKMGAMIGAGVGVLVALADPECRGGGDDASNHCGALVIGTGIVSAGLGAAIGAVVYLGKRAG